MSVYLYYNQDKLIQQIITEANKQLNVEVKVDKIQLNWYQDFPNISINCSKVTVGESYKNSRSPLANFETLSLSFDILPLIQGKYVLNRLKLSEGKAYLKINKEGLRNFEVIKENTDSKAPSTKVSFKIENILLQNIHFQYEDANLSQDIKLFSSSSVAKLNVEGDDLYIDLNGALQSDYISIQELKYLEEKSLDIDASVVYNLKSELLSIQPSELKVNNNLFNVSGTFNIDNSKIDLKAKGVEADLKTIISLLPKEYEEYVKDYRSSGNALFEAEIKGTFNSQQNPLVNIQFQVNNGIMVEPTFNTQVDSIQLKGSFTNGYDHSLRTSKLTISGLNAIIANELIQADFELKNFDKPHLTLATNGKVSTADLFSFLPGKENYSQLTGMIQFNINLAGKVADFKSASTAFRIDNSGELVLSELGGIYKDYPLPFSAISGRLLFNKNDIAVNSLSGKIGESDIQMNGFFLNIFPYLLTDDQSILIEAETKSNFIDLNELLSGLSNKSNSAEKQQASYRFSLSPYLQLDLKSSIDKLIFQRFDGRKLRGAIIVQDQQLRARQFSVNTMGGKIALNGSIDTAPENTIDIKTTASFQQLNIDSIFYTFHDFKQDFLTQRHLKGKIDADLLAKIALDKSLNFIPSAFEASISASIKDGKLTDFEPMQSLSDYVNEEDLANLSFGELKNSIQIKDETIYLPEMTIKSNISEIQIQGTHTFDQEIDYKLLVPLKNYKKADKDEAFGAIEETKDYTKLHLKITGTTDNFDVSWDAKRSINSVGQKIKEEVKTIKDLLKGEKKKEEEKQLEVEEDEYIDW